MQTISKTHEKNVQTAVHVEKVDTILSDVENVPFALRGATVKTILYWLFSVIAAAELSAAFFFYISSFEMPQAVAAVIAVVLAFFLHGLIHAQLTDTSKGMVFSKHRESKAMSSEVKMNIVLSIILLFFAAGCVFFLGKKGYTAFREMKYQTALLESKGKDAPKGLVLTADMLTSKKGKISMDKLEQATALQNATAKATDATVQAATADKVNYDKSTANITDVVGSSAFILELILGLLAYAIATAKFAATFDEIAKRGQQTNPSVVTNGQQATGTQPSDAPQATPSVLQDVKQMPYSELIDGLKNSLCQNLASSYNLLDDGEDVTGIIIHHTLMTIDANVLTDNQKYVAIASDCKANFTRELLKRLGLTASVTDAVTAKKTTQNPIGFRKTGNEGRAVIRGFQQRNAAEPTATTASVTDAVTAKDTSSVLPENMRVCLYCEEAYIYKIHNQKYCCEDCRILDWQEKNGVQLRKKSKA